MHDKVIREGKEWYSFPSGFAGNVLIGIPLGRLKVYVAGPMLVESAAPVYQQVYHENGKYIHVEGKVLYRNNKIVFEHFKCMECTDLEHGKRTFEAFQQSFYSLPEITFLNLLEKLGA